MDRCPEREKKKIHWQQTPRTTGSDNAREKMKDGKLWLPHNKIKKKKKDSKSRASRQFLFYVLAAEPDKPFTRKQTFLTNALLKGPLNSNARV